MPVRCTGNKSYKSVSIILVRVWWLRLFMLPARPMVLSWRLSFLELYLFILKTTLSCFPFSCFFRFHFLVLRVTASLLRVSPNLSLYMRTCIAFLKMATSVFTDIPHSGGISNLYSIHFTNMYFINSLELPSR